MPFGLWTPLDWSVTEAPAAGAAKALGPSQELLRAKAEARKLRSETLSQQLSKGPSLVSTRHHSSTDSRWHQSSTSLGDALTSVEMPSLSVEWSCESRESVPREELFLEHSETVLGHWKKQNLPRLWVDGWLGGDLSELSKLDSDATSTSLLEQLDLDAEAKKFLGARSKKKTSKTSKTFFDLHLRFSVSDAVQLIAGGTVIGAVAEEPCSAKRKRLFGAGHAAKAEEFGGTRHLQVGKRRDIHFSRRVGPFSACSGAIWRPASASGSLRTRCGRSTSRWRSGGPWRYGEIRPDTAPRSRLTPSLDLTYALTSPVESFTHLEMP